MTNSALLVFICSVGIFGGIIFFEVDTDIQQHSWHIFRINIGESSWPPNFLYYFLVNGLSGFSTAIAVVNSVAIAVLSVAMTFKYVLTVGISRDFTGGQTTSKLLFFSACMLVVFPLPNISLITNHQFYLGQIVPNVWHNSTVIFLFPFALLLFWQQFCVLRDDNRKQIWLLVLLVGLSIAIKPSFFLAFFPATAIMLLRRFGFGKPFWIHSIPLLFGLMLLGVQYYLLYRLQLGSFQGDRSGTELAPFAVWFQFIPIYLVPTAAVTSFLFPMGYIAGRMKPEHGDLMTYAVLLMASSMLIFILMAETGPRRFDGNFYWQNVTCMYLLNLVIGIDVYDKWVNKGMRTVRAKILVGIFLSSVLSGLAYLVWIFMGTYK
jgi:hypothetical protein